MIRFLFPVGFFVALLLIWFFFRSGGYKRHPLDAPPGRDWTLTAERFRDPQSGGMLDAREPASAPMSGRGAAGAHRSGRRRRPSQAATDLIAVRAIGQLRPVPPR